MKFEATPELKQEIASFTAFVIELILLALVVGAIFEACGLWRWPL